MEKNITRTFTKTEVNATLYNKETGAIDTETIVIENPGKDLLATVRAELESENLSVVSAEVTRVVSTRYTMTAADFIAHAKVAEDKKEANTGTEGTSADVEVSA